MCVAEREKNCFLIHNRKNSNTWPSVVSGHFCILQKLFCSQFTLIDRFVKNCRGPETKNKGNKQHIFCTVSQRWKPVKKYTDLPHEVQSQCLISYFCCWLEHTSWCRLPNFICTVQFLSQTWFLYILLRKWETGAVKHVKTCMQIQYLRQKQCFNNSEECSSSGISMDVQTFSLDAAFRSVFSPVFTHSPNMCPVFGKALGESPCWSIYNILFLSNCVIVYVLIEKEWCMTDLGCTHSLYETCGHYYQSSSDVIWRTSAFSLCFRSFRKPPFHWDHFW